MDDVTGMPVVGIVGAGQLARMCQPSAVALGVTLRLLAASATDGAALVVPGVQVGEYTNLDDLRRFAASCDVVTWDHEHVPNEHITALADDGVDVQPGANALVFAQDKAAMRRRLSELDIACPAWIDLEHSDDARRDLAAFGAQVGWPLVLKASRHGYDGKGVWVIDSLDEADELLASGTPLLAEERVPIEHELAADVARNPSGEVAAWPVVETVQRDGICVEVIAPASAIPSDIAVAAQDMARRIATELGVTGVLAVELFATTDGRLVVNELAMRPHNSGHWTIEGSVTSQFEQHLRAVLDLPLGDTTVTAPFTVMANVLASDAALARGELRDRVAATMRQWPAAKIHLYGKGWRPGRKVGHVTVRGDDLAVTHACAVAAADLVANGNDRSVS